MNKRFATIITILILLLFVAYIVIDLVTDREKPAPGTKKETNVEQSDNWIVTGIVKPDAGRVRAVAITSAGELVIGGESFIVAYDNQKSLIWKKKTDKPVTAVSASRDTILMTDGETVTLLSMKGERISEYGPFEDNAIITSLASNDRYIVAADAGNRILVLLDKRGRVKNIIGKSGEPFIIPSPYFDVAIDRNNNIFVANTGQRRIERRDTEGRVISFFGTAGTAAESFCGCCNPAHFALIPQGFVTAEKGLNRIKIMTPEGKFSEYISSRNNFTPNIPLDLAAYDGKLIYAANPADSSVYIFRRK